MGFIGFDPFGGRCFTTEMAFGERLFYFVLFVSCACLVIVVVFFLSFSPCLFIVGFCFVWSVGWLVGWLAGYCWLVDL